MPRDLTDMHHASPGLHLHECMPIYRGALSSLHGVCTCGTVVTTVMLLLSSHANLRWHCG